MWVKSFNATVYQRKSLRAKIFVSHTLTRKHTQMLFNEMLAAVKFVVGLCAWVVSFY